jgi:hypothetical protein
VWFNKCQHCGRRCAADQCAMWLYYNMQGVLWQQMRSQMNTLRSFLLCSRLCVRCCLDQPHKGEIALQQHSVHAHQVTAKPPELQQAASWHSTLHNKAAWRQTQLWRCRERCT